MPLRDHLANNGKTNRFIPHFCRFVFCLFSVFYLFFFQKELLEIKYEKYLSDTIPYLLEGIIILLIILLLLLQVLIGKLFTIRKWIGLSYLPSFLLLGIITYYQEFYIPIFNWTLFIVLLTLLSLPVFRISRKWTFDKYSYPLYLLNMNLLLMVILSLLTLSIGNTQINYHHELAANHYLNERNWEKLLKVGHKNLTPSHRLTILRFIALAGSHKTGESLFEYPQLYGSKGLLFSQMKEEGLSIDSLPNFYYLPEDRPYTEEEIESFLKKMYEEGEDKEVLFNYYAAALLLQKKTDTFVKLMNEANFFVQNEIPKHYQEALILANYLSPGIYNLSINEEMNKQFTEFIQLKEKDDSKAAKNYIRKEYSNTYWWYYYYR